MARSVFTSGISGRTLRPGMRITRTSSEAVNAINAIIRAFDQVKGLSDRAAQRAARRIGNVVLENTIPFVPVDTHALELSGRVTEEKTARGWRSRVTFGGETPITGKNSPEGVVHYAALVHENVGHDYSKPEKPYAQAKYLETGLALSMEDIQSIVFDELKEAGL